MARPIGTLPQQKRRLAQSILRGLQNRTVSEYNAVFLEKRTPYAYVAPRPYCACALGMALVGKNGSAKEACKSFNELFEKEIWANQVMIIADMLRISPHLAQRVSDLHASDDISAKEIAEKLFAEAKGK